jgi:type IV secretion system protein VirB4
MISLRRIVKDYRDSGALNALVNLHAALDETTFLTKGGAILAILQAQGVDYECLDPGQLDQVCRRFEAALRVFGEDFRIYQYVLKRTAPPIPHDTDCGNPVVQEALASRLAYLSAKADRLYTQEIYFAVAYEGWEPARPWRKQASLLMNPLQSLKEALSTGAKTAAMEDGLKRAGEILSTKVGQFAVQLQDSVQVEVLGKHDAFRFLRRLLNYAPHKSEGVRLKYDAFVDYQACGSALECYPDHLRLDNYSVQVLTLKEPPARTFAQMLRGLQELPCEYILASEWKRESPAAARKAIHSKRRHFHNSKTALSNYLGGAQTAARDMLIDDSAAGIVTELGACLQELELQGQDLGQFSLTVILYDENRERLRRAVAECFKVFATHDAQLTEERYNLLNAFLAILPGNHIHSLRAMWLLSRNYADLSFLFRSHTGETENLHLGTESLAVLETNHGSPYFLNLHYQDVAHTLVLGATGSGKSFLLNFLVTHLQKYQPLTFIFDLGGSYENLTRLLEGTYAPVGALAAGLRVNPFSLPPTPENLQFLFSFVKVLAETGTYRLTTEDEKDLYAQIENVYAVEPEQRRLFTLANVLGRPLRASLQKWVQGGQYGSLFDNIEDNLTLARFQTFDFEGMDKHPQVLEPLLFYVLHRASAAIYDPELTGTLKVFVMDEAWRFFRHPTIKHYILEGLKTWRKKNGAMILATQSSEDLLRSEMIGVVVESCPTKMFLANPDADLTAYREIFHLNETESQWIARLAPKQQILIKRPDLAKVVNLNVERAGYWLYTNSPLDNQKKREAFDRHGFAGGLKVLAEEK